MNKVFFLMFGVFGAFSLAGQCENWSNSPKKDAAEESHVIYRQAIKVEDWAVASENWEKVFNEFPAADGMRDIQYFDGIEIMKHKASTAANDTDKKAAYERMAVIYDQLANCYISGGLKSASEDAKNKKLGYIYGRKAYDQYYYANVPYVDNMESINNAIKYGGVDNEYIFFDPAAKIAVYEFKDGSMPKNEVVELYQKLNEIADYNINNNESLADYYTQAKENINGTFSEIENDIFDCDYFKEKLQPEYESDSDNPDVIKNIIGTLKARGCDSSDEFLSQLEAKWAKFASQKNAAIQAEFEANNPAILAKKLYDEGKFGEALQKYDEAIDSESNPDRKASYLFSKASIQFRKLSSYSAARSTAMEAARLKPNWGRPYMLIGDMYGKSARTCGDAWTQRLAIIAAIDKYAYARSLDSEVADEAGQRIGAYSASLPDQEMGFMRGIKEGQSVNVGCWIGETVKVRYK